MSRDNKVIPYGKHSIDSKDIASVIEVLENRFLTQGSMVPDFESRLSEYTGSHCAVAVSSGTSGLHIACLALGITSGDLVWTVPNSFVASANCALYCGADIDFVDIDQQTRNLSIEALKHKLIEAHSAGRLPKALIVVHFAGQSCDMKAIQDLTQPYGIKLIEDAAHGLGGSFLNGKIGSCQFSDMTVLSFHPVKSITTAEGGAVLTNDAMLAQRLALFAKHGVTRDHNLMDGESEGPWYYQQIELGYNYRLSDLHAALGVSQLQKLDSFIALRRQLAANYQRELQDLPLRLPQVPTYTESAWHLYVVEVIEGKRKHVYDALQKRGIGVNVHYIPIHLQPYYRRRGFRTGDFPHAERFYQNAITLPLFPSMTADEQNKVVQALKEVLL